VMPAMLAQEAANQSSGMDVPFLRTRCRATTGAAQSPGTEIEWGSRNASTPCLPS
jgi:hypothetical protein